MSVFFDANTPQFGYMKQSAFSNDDVGVDAPWFQNTGEAIARGLYEGASVLGEVASSVVADQLPRGKMHTDASTGELPSRDWRAWWDENITAPATSSRMKSQERARTYGAAASAMHDIARIGLEAAGGPLTVLAAESTFQGVAASDEGKSSGEASLLGLERGGAMALMTAVPPVLPILKGFGPALLQRMATGGVASVGGGLLLRGVDKETLALMGYDEESAQTAVVSPESMVADAVLGTVFGALAHGHKALEARKLGIPLSVIDDAMAVNLRDVGRSFAKKAGTTEAQRVEWLDDFQNGLDQTAEGKLPDADGKFRTADEVLAAAPKADTSPASVEGSSKAAEEIALGPGELPEGSATATLADRSAERTASKEQGADLPTNLEHPDVRALLEHMATEGGWSEIGGRIKRSGEGANDTENASQVGEVVGRTSWVPHAPWFADVQRGSPLPGNTAGAATAEAVRKALAGEKLKPPERGHIIAMVEHIKGETQLAADAGVPDYEAVAMAQAYEEYAGTFGGENPSPADAVDAAAVEAAMRVDEMAVERASIKHAGNDAAFMDEIRSINETGKQGAAAGETGKAVPKQKAEFPPDLQIRDDAGNLVNANAHLDALRQQATADPTPDLEKVRQCILAKMTGSV